MRTLRRSLVVLMQRSLDRTAAEGGGGRGGGLPDPADATVIKSGGQSVIDRAAPPSIRS